MELSALALHAASIALWAVDKVSGGALEKVGADILEFLTHRFQGRLQIEETKSSLLEAAILSEAEQDIEFRERLENLVKQYQCIQNDSVSQENDSGVNIYVKSNPGTVIGQQIGQQFFR